MVSKLEAERQKKATRIRKSLYLQANAIAEAFSKLVQDHPEDSPWRFTYAISLSAEPIPKYVERTEVTRGAS